MACLVLAGCDTAEERAEKHYQSAMTLLEEGDVDRAIVEFRNVFKLNDRHHGARLAFANLLREQGFATESFREYQRLVEQYPDDFDGRLALADLALDRRDWNMLQLNATRAVELQPDNARAQALSNVAAYYNSLRDKDDAAMAETVRKAEVLVKGDGDQSGSRKIIIDDRIRNGKWEDALSEVDKAIAESPDELGLYRTKMGILNQLNDTAAMRVLLEQMDKQFPNNADIKRALVAYYVQNEDLDAAEERLRAQAEASDDPQDTTMLISYLLQYRNAQAAQEELDRVIAAGRLPKVPFQVLQAKLKFAQGQQDEAIAGLEAITEGETERTDDIRAAEVQLAQFYFQRQNAVEARRLVEKVLAEDPSNPTAVSLKAAWLIEDDAADDAIVILRDALSKTPRNAPLLTLMALAHEREGNHDLMMESLSLAVEASDNAPEESIRYARALAAQEQFIPAEDILISALRLLPKNLQLLDALGDLYVRMGNWAQVDGVIRRLQEIDTEVSRNMALSLNANSLNAQNRSDELLEVLEGIQGNPTTEKAAEIAIFRTRLQDDGPEAAMSYVDGLLAKSPEDPEFNYLRAGLLVMQGRADEAEPIYQSLVDRFPKNALSWMGLYRMKLFQGDRAGADATLQDALKAIPQDPTLRISLAEQLQRSNQFEDAIGIYEELYEANPNSVPLANNLASLLADHRTDQASLERAELVSRRLRGTKIPAAQDTYGWIAFRMGNTAEALPYLEGAATGLSNDPRVQYHYGVALAADGQTDKAMEFFQKAQTLLTDTDPVELKNEVKAAIDKLNAPPEQPKND